MYGVNALPEDRATLGSDPSEGFTTEVWGRTKACGPFILWSLKRKIPGVLGAAPPYKIRFMPLSIILSAPDIGMINGRIFRFFVRQRFSIQTVF